MYHTRQYSNGNSSVMIARFERIVSSEVYQVESNYQVGLLWGI